ncbi:MAG: hypothetical protein JGK29_01915 [Microcoleus sp. PH2017_17_BER_D_A]|nr:hypothetical protein [Microcoleus sp. PH2017_17_BER_D_A]MCC3552393.1 hypothetical protein [Microcoleus sp. PH2017_35_SFW_U_B]
MVSRLARPVEVSIDLLNKSNIQAVKHLTSLWAAVSYAFMYPRSLSSPTTLKKLRRSCIES